MALNIASPSDIFESTLEQTVQCSPTANFCQGIRIGDVALSIISDEQIPLGSGLIHFQSENDHADIELRVDWEEYVAPIGAPPVFDSEAVWALFKNKSELIFDFRSLAFGTQPYKRLITDDSFRHARIVLNSALLRDHSEICPLEYPADELLVTNYLSCGFGVEVHGCGVVDAESGGHLFLGHSGAGKSTTAKVWDYFRGAEILSDDRIILRIHDGELWMYGTPWHGESVFATPQQSRIDRIFVIDHGKRNQMSVIPSARAAGELFARSFPPFHSSAGLDNTMAFLSRVVGLVPCYDFRFVPDFSAIENVLAFHE